MYKDFDVSVVHGLFVALMFTYLLITCVYNEWSFVAHNLAGVYKCGKYIISTSILPVLRTGY